MVKSLITNAATEHQQGISSLRSKLGVFTKEVRSCIAALKNVSSAHQSPLCHERSYTAGKMHW